MTFLSLRRQNIFERVLIDPLLDGCDELSIVVGYASPSLLATYLARIRDLELKQRVKINLLVGMPDSLTESAISAYRGLSYRDASLFVRVLSPNTGVSIHSKLYLWAKEGVAKTAWSGSVNFTRIGLGLSSESDSRDEILAEIEVSDAESYLKRVMSEAAELSDNIPRDYLLDTVEQQPDSEDRPFVLPEELSTSKFSICPLIDLRTGKVHNPGAGLNWGQPTATRVRKDAGAAYIPLPSDQREIFPEPGILFEVELHDGQIFFMSRTQANGKAITVPSSNSLLGSFFRHKLQVEGDSKVLDHHLQTFGANCVVFEKLRGEARFRMHFYPGLYFSELKSRRRDID